MNYLFIVLFSLIFVFCACEKADQGGSAADYDANTPKGQASVVDNESAINILQIAAGSKDHTTLVAAVQAAEIEHVLVNNGPLTVFAPTNAAFDALPEGTVATLLKPENKGKLAFILTNHASPSTYDNRLLKDGLKMYMATGEYITVKRDGDDVYIGEAKILGSVRAANGIVHVIDKVLVPPDK